MGGGRLILFGFLLCLGAVVIAMLMVLKTITTSFGLALVVFAMSVGGLFLGMLGSARYIRDRHQ